MALTTQITIWMAFTTTAQAGCESRSAGTSRAKCTDGRKLIKPLRTGCGRNLTSLTTFRPATNTLRRTPGILSSVTTVCSHGTHSSYRRWKWQDCGNRPPIPIIVLLNSTRKYLTFRQTREYGKSHFEHRCRGYRRISAELRRRRMLARQSA